MDSKQNNLHTPIIIDIGSGQIKAGFSGKELPIKIDNYFGEPKYKTILKKFDKDNKLIKEQYYGKACGLSISALKLRYPVKHGIFTDPEDISPVFRNIFASLNLNSEDIKNHPILLTEPLLNPSKNRESIASILFEQFEIPK